MKPRLAIIGAGLAGCTAAALLKRRYRITLYDPRGIGGLCRDAAGVQECGPHAFHTSDAAVWRFVQRFAVWKPYTLRVHVLTDGGLRELPSADPAFRVYSEKAWQRPFEQIPAEVVNRVPRTSGPYHADKWRAQPVGGYSAMMARMIDGCELDAGPYVTRDDQVEYLCDCRWPVVWTGTINMLAGMHPFPWAHRNWTHSPGVLPLSLIHYALHAVPQLRSYDDGINPHHRPAAPTVTTEWAGDGAECYPAAFDAATRKRADGIIAEWRKRKVYLCGRMATYRYLDMDATIRNVMDTIKEAGL